MKESELRAQHENVQAFNEHGQDWIQCLACGATWSVVETDQGPDCEVISDGDESCLTNSLRTRIKIKVEGVYELPSPERCHILAQGGEPENDVEREWRQSQLAKHPYQAMPSKADTFEDYPEPARKVDL